MSKEKNEITNKQLKENLANAAIGMLKKGRDYSSLAYTSVEFGYLYNIEDHGLEALYKVITDKKTLYFAAQGRELLLLTINEEQFRNVTKRFTEQFEEQEGI